MATTRHAPTSVAEEVTEGGPASREVYILMPTHGLLRTRMREPRRVVTYPTNATAKENIREDSSTYREKYCLTPRLVTRL